MQGSLPSLQAAKKVPMERGSWQCQIKTSAAYACQIFGTAQRYLSLWRCSWPSVAGSFTCARSTCQSSGGLSDLCKRKKGLSHTHKQQTVVRAVTEHHVKSCFQCGKKSASAKPRQARGWGLTRMPLPSALAISSLTATWRCTKARPVRWGKLDLSYLHRATRSLATTAQPAG